MKFDGSDIVSGDSVFDIAYGSGNVDRINDELDAIYVKFGPKGFTYNSKGIGTFPRKTLFWRDPIDSFTPCKKDATWDVYVKIRSSVLSALGKL